MKGKRAGLALVGLLLAASASSAMASSTNGYGKITSVTATSDGALVFSVDASFYSTATKSRRATAKRDAPPACAGGQPDKWALDVSAITGQAAAQALLWAAQNHRLISVTGTGGCSVAKDAETVATFDVQYGE